MDRKVAFELLKEYTKSESLIKHALAVEEVMRAYAQHFGEDEEKWGIVGLLHDFDYERYPDPQEHAFKGAEILRARGYPDDVARAVMAHSDHTGTKRVSLLEKSLYAVDEPVGFIIAVALVRPNKKMSEVDVVAVTKKMKDKAFARAVDRDMLIRGAAELGVEFDSHVDFVIKALQRIAARLGL